MLDVASSLRCAQVRSSSSSSSPYALHQVSVSAPRTDPNTCNLWGPHEWKLISHQPRSKINFVSLKQVAQGVEFQPHQFFTGKQACVFIYAHAFAHTLADFKIICMMEIYRLAVNTTTAEVFIILGNNLFHGAIIRARQSALSRACTGALAFLEHKPVV